MSLFTFDIPGNTEKLQNVETIEHTQLSERFMCDCKKFCEYVYANVKVKTVADSYILTGKCKIHKTIPYMSMPHSYILHVIKYYPIVFCYLAWAMLVERYVECTRPNTLLPCIRSTAAFVIAVMKTDAFNEALQIYENHIDQLFDKCATIPSNIDEQHDEISDKLKGQVQHLSLLSKHATKSFEVRYKANLYLIQ